MQRVVYLVLAVLFALFAIAQLNDVDPYGWVVMYGSVALFFIVAAFRPIDRRLLLLGMIVAGVWFLSLLPEFIDWVRMGMPSITEKMKAEEPYIEYTREFLGLALCIGAFFYLYRRN